MDAVFGQGRRVGEDRSVVEINRTGPMLLCLSSDSIVESAGEARHVLYPLCGETSPIWACGVRAL